MMKVIGISNELQCVLIASVDDVFCDAEIQVT